MKTVIAAETDSQEAMVSQIKHELNVQILREISCTVKLKGKPIIVKTFAESFTKPDIPFLRAKPRSSEAFILLGYFG